MGLTKNCSITYNYIYSDIAVFEKSSTEASEEPEHAPGRNPFSSSLETQTEVHELCCLSSPSHVRCPARLHLVLLLQPFLYLSESCGCKYNSVFCARWGSRAKNVIRVMNGTCLVWKRAFQMTHRLLKAAELHWCPSSRPFLEYGVKQKHCFDSYVILMKIIDFRELITRRQVSKIFFFIPFSFFLLFLLFFFFFLFSFSFSHFSLFLFFLFFFPYT